MMSMCKQRYAITGIHFLKSSAATLLQFARNRKSKI